MYYSDNEGASWTSITAPATLLNVSSVPCHLYAWGSKVILVYKPSSPGTTICSKLRDDTLANKNTWGSEVTLYTSSRTRKATTMASGCCRRMWLPRRLS